MAAPPDRGGLVTVKEVIAELQKFPQELNVYVPSDDGRVDIAKSIHQLVHLNLPEGIVIPDDVVISPWTDEEFEGLSDRH